MEFRIYQCNAGRFCIQSFADNADYFKIGDRFDVIFVGRTLYVEKNPKGSITCSKPSPHEQKDVVSRLTGRVGTMQFMPAFHVSFAEFDVDGETLSWECPPIYNLPWTVKKPADAKTCAIAGLRARLESAQRRGVNPQVVTKKVPSWARSALTPQEWRECVENALGTV